MSRFPECEKLAQVSDTSQAIGEFLDWLQTVHGVTLPASIQDLLHQYFEVDAGKVEAERRLLLRTIRRTQLFNEDVD